VFFLSHLNQVRHGLTQRFDGNQRSTAKGKIKFNRSLIPLEPQFVNLEVIIFIFLSQEMLYLMDVE